MCITLEKSMYNERQNYSQRNIMKMNISHQQNNRTRTIFIELSSLARLLCHLHTGECSIQPAYVIFTCMMMMMAKRTLKILQPYPDQLQFSFFYNVVEFSTKFVSRVHYHPINCGYSLVYCLRKYLC